MLRPRLILPLAILALSGSWPAAAQQAPLYVRQKAQLFGRTSPFVALDFREMLTFEQQMAIAPVTYPAVWPAPNVPPGTVLTVPMRPKGLPGPGEYWGPFLNDLGGWGFMVGPIPPAPPPTAQSWNDALLFATRRRGGILLPPVQPPPPPEPVLPVAGPISPDGQMVVSYPDGKQVTWQFPMVEYTGTWNGLGPGGGFWVTVETGRRRAFRVARIARFTFNGRNIDPRKVPIGAQVKCRALRSIPHILTVMEFST